MCARARLKIATAWLGEAATNCGSCPRPLCSAALQAPGAGAGGSPGPCTMRALQAPGAGAGGSPGPCTMRAPAASPMEGTAPLLRGPRRAAVPDGQPRGDAVAQM